MERGADLPQAPSGDVRTTGRLGYQPALNGLRGIAILLVIASHTIRPMAGGAGGVDIFFALSGFLITTLLIQERSSAGKVSFPRFYARRVLRLYPALIVMIVLVSAVGGWTRIDPHPARDVFSALFYFANFSRAGGQSLHGFGQTWSLAQEEQFYVLWPAILVGLLAVGGRRLALRVTAVVTVAVWAARLLAWLNGTGWYTVYFLPWFRADSLTLGCCLALFGTERLVGRWVVPAAVFLGVLALWNWGQSQRAMWGMDALAIATALMIAEIINRPGSRAVRWLSSPDLVRAGVLSYGLYLWHYPIVTWGRVWLPQEGLPDRFEPLWVLPLAWLAASISYRVVELPLLKLKARFAAEPPREATRISDVGARAHPVRAELGGSGDLEHPLQGHTGPLARFGVDGDAVAHLALGEPLEDPAQVAGVDPEHGRTRADQGVE
jgi:peptidoglycan/LPS O-acetylase OafA/YrhL